MRLTRHNKPRSDAGLTLIELAIAIFVLALGSIAAIRAADQSRVAIGGEIPRILARQAAQNRVEERKLYGMTASLPSSVTMGGLTFVIDEDVAITTAGLAQVAVTARASNGEGAQLVVYLAGGL
ncbi:prepilin-type N-terminal cleavage/methylation domain-containing protein [Shimia sp. MIT1388]|uniref:prepilin-type N-terminal cleavage/methylation domain-containing protein n=1 Tax=Shimia sp. MIT1388 TaxID=3096992 RepID=UPI00399C4289